MGRPKNKENTHLPKRVTISKGRYCYREYDFINKRPGRQYTIGDLSITNDEIIEKINLIKQKNMLFGDLLLTTKFMKRLYSRCKTRARKTNKEFTLTFDELEEAMIATNGYCSLTKLPFSDINETNYSMRPWMPSIDRIDNEKGYTKDNIRIICTAVNLMLNQFGANMLKFIASQIPIKDTK